MATSEAIRKQLLKDLTTNGLKVTPNQIVLDTFYYAGGGVSPLIVVAVYNLLMEYWMAYIAPYFSVGNPELDDEEEIQKMATLNGHKVTENVAKSMFPIVSGLKLPYKNH